jgi:hypothetical protein
MSSVDTAKKVLENLVPKNGGLPVLNRSESSQKYSWNEFCNLTGGEVGVAQMWAQNRYQAVYQRCVEDAEVIKAISRPFPYSDTDVKMVIKYTDGRLQTIYLPWAVFAGLSPIRRLDKPRLTRIK